MFCAVTLLATEIAVREASTLRSSGIYENGIIITAVAVVIGVALGLLIALMRMSKKKVLRGISTVYIEILRGTPLDRFPMHSTLQKNRTGGPLDVRQKIDGLTYG